MKKLLSFTLVLLLVFGMSIPAIAGINTESSDLIIPIEIINTEHVIDDSALAAILNAEQDSAKRDLLTLFFYMPVTVHLETSYVKQEKEEVIVTKEQITKAKQLATLDVTELRVTFNNMIDEKINEIRDSGNIFATPQLYEHLEKTNPLSLSLIQDKLMDGNHIMPMESTGEVYGQSQLDAIVHKYYYNTLSYDSLAITVLKSDLRVEWQYNDSTNKITGRSVSADYWHTGVTPITHVFADWSKNTAFIKSTSSGDRLFVQEGRKIIYPSYGTYWAMHKYNLVFDPSVSNAQKLLLNDVGVAILFSDGRDPTNWGGGY